jgi:hypothetical protein
LERYSDNVTGADNQQERLDSYIAGYVDGEGSFSISVQRNESCRIGFQLVPEFHVSQNDVIWSHERLSPAVALEEGVELTMDASDEHLVVRIGARYHVRLPFDDLQPRLIGEGHVVGVRDKPFWPGGHVLLQSIWEDQTIISATDSPSSPAYAGLEHRIVTR